MFVREEEGLRGGGGGGDKSPTVRSYLVWGRRTLSRKTAMTVPLRRGGKKKEKKDRLMAVLMKGPTHEASGAARLLAGKEKKGEGLSCVEYGALIL